MGYRPTRRVSTAALTGSWLAAMPKRCHPRLANPGQAYGRGTSSGLPSQWIKNHRVAHDVARRLLDATTVRRHRRSGFAELAAFMDVEP